MRVLGLSAFYHDSAAALVVDGRIVAAAQEERFTRVKHDAACPAQAAAWCLAEAGLTPGDLDLVAFHEKPLLKFERLLETHLACAPASLRPFVRAMPSWLRRKLHVGREVRAGLNAGRAPGARYERRVAFAEHHGAHAASAFLPSPFESAAVLTLDGVGEWATASVGRGQGGGVTLLEELRFPHSLGLLYSAVTQLCGFAVNDGEYKVMGLAPYGEPRFARLLREQVLDLRDDGSFRVDPRYVGYLRGLTMTTPRLHRLLGRGPRAPDAPLSAFDMDLAASVQQVTEEVMLRAARHAHARTGERRLCLAGGVALNGVGNGRILREGPFEEVWIQPAAGDAGGALGAALWAAHTLLHEPRPAVPPGRDRMHGARLGPAYPAATCRAAAQEAARAHGWRAEVLPEPAALVERAAELLAAGRVLGWFQGRMEYGPRALGGRSILADPRDPAMQSRVNRMVKFRESFRPFAPAVRAEDARAWFDLPPGATSPYMLLVLPVAAARRLPAPAGAEPTGLARLGVPRSTVPAVTHVDGSARLQTVEAADDPLFHALLSAFERRTGCPLLVNTSFNVKDEPIVQSPADALRCFAATGIDALLLGDALLEKPAGTPAGERPAAPSGGPRRAGRDALEGPVEHAGPALTPATLRLTPLLPLVLAALPAGLLAQGGAPAAAWGGTLALGAALALLLLALPRARGPVLRGWLRIAGPLGTALSALLLGAVYLLVLTPVGLLLRALGKDVLGLRREPGRPSYFDPVEPRPDPEDAFRRY